MADASASALGVLRTQIGASVQIFQHRQMREQIEVLEHHADFAAHLIDVLEVVGQRNAIHHNVALLVFFQPVDAADHRRLAGAGRPADDDAFALFDIKIDVPQHMELAVPFVDGFQHDGGLGVADMLTSCDRC